MEHSLRSKILSDGNDGKKLIGPSTATPRGPHDYRVLSTSPVRTPSPFHPPTGMKKGRGDGLVSQ